MTAEADGKYGTRSELEGAGIARVDVYCKTGTVITCRVIQTNHSTDTGFPSVIVMLVHLYRLIIAPYNNRARRTIIMLNSMVTTAKDYPKEMHIISIEKHTIRPTKVTRISTLAMMETMIMMMMIHKHLQSPRNQVKDNKKSSRRVYFPI